MKAGAVLPMPVYVWPCALISARTVEVVGFDRSLFLLCERMAKTLEATKMIQGGNMLAATQIGDTRRVVMVRMGVDSFATLINPRVLNQGPKVVAPDYDLSFPVACVDVARSESLHVEYSSLTGQRTSIHLDGAAARDVQRGIDYLDGRTLFDHAGWFKRRSLRAKYRKAIKHRFPTRIDHLTQDDVRALTGGKV